MEKLLGILIVMEMLAVNLFSVNLCCTRNYSRFKTFAVLAGFTVILTSVTSGLWEPMGFEDGNALFAVIGVVYLIPLHLLYQEPFLQISGILFSAWIYTLMMYCISVRATYMVQSQSFIIQVLVIQTILYILTVSGFMHWVRDKFLCVIHNITKANQRLLQAISLSWYGAVIFVNACLIYQGSHLLDFAAVIFLGVNIVLTYRMTASMFKSLGEVKSLQDIVYIDSLTSAYNREKLFLDGEALVKSQKRFRLIYMDLNYFKSVNDKYGHQKGDQYLVDFVRCTWELLADSDKLYRISGDEFVIISCAGDAGQALKRLSLYPSTMGETPFLGVSIGWADYPKDRQVLDQIIALADEHMYSNKHKTNPEK